MNAMLLGATAPGDSAADEIQEAPSDRNATDPPNCTV
jgi:hypothetical protein